MKTREIIAKAATLYSLVFMFIIALAHGVQADDSANRYVSVGGSDSNYCTRVAPCRTFAGAIAKTRSGGEIIALDSGEYGGVMIFQSVTLTGAPGVSAVIGEATTIGDAVDIYAGASDVVVLRNLIVSCIGTPSTASGVYFSGGGTLYIEDCVVRGWASGIEVSPSVSGNTRLHLFVSDTAVSSCGRGIYLAAFGNTLSIQASVEHCRLENNGTGLQNSSGSASYATVRNTLASGNGTAFINEGSSGENELNIANCEAWKNVNGIENKSGTVRVASSAVTNNSSVGFLNAAGGKFQSLGNNLVRGNGQNVQGTITTISGT